MKKLTFAITTIGCKLNQYEADQISAGLIAGGLKQIDFKERADIYIINTCSVTAMADHKSRQILRRITRIIPKPFLAVVGCGVDNPDSNIMSLGADLILKSIEKDKLPQLILDKHGLTYQKPTYFSSKTRAFIKIQDGCNCYCSYCIVPHLRGKPKSRNFVEIISEVNQAICLGFKEIVITGVNIALYGDSNKDLADLLLTIDNLSGDFRIRLSSLELFGLSEKFLNYAALSKKLCCHLHLPLQSGSNNILKIMNRKYSAEDFLTKIKSAKEVFGPNLALTTDVIVGFPGETNSDFDQTKALVKEIGFSKVHVFKYSARKGTKAYSFKGQLSIEIKKKRSCELMVLSNKLRDNFIKSQLLKSHRVLGERYNNRLKQIEGLTDNYLRVQYCGTKEMVNQFRRINGRYLLQNR